MAVLTVTGLLRGEIGTRYDWDAKRKAPPFARWDFSILLHRLVYLGYRLRGLSQGFPKPISVEAFRPVDMARAATANKTLNIVCPSFNSSLNISRSEVHRKLRFRRSIGPSKSKVYGHILRAKINHHTRSACCVESGKY
jgi:hypothetical protein